MMRKQGILRFLFCSFALLLLPFSSLLFSAAFESNGLGARALSLGNSFVAMNGSYESVFWNPAGIATLKDRTFHSEYRTPFGLGLLRTVNSGYVHPGVGHGAIGFTWMRLDTTGDASYLDYAENTLIVSYGAKIVDKLYAGINGKYYRVNSTVGAGGMGMDLGFTYTRWGILAGASIQDVTNSVISWDSGAKDKLPRRSRIGLSGRPFENTLVTSQISWEDETNRSHHAGIEHSLFDQLFSVRVGVTEQSKDWRFSWGVGIKTRLLTFDYAWERQRLLGDTQVFSASVRF